MEATEVVRILKNDILKYCHKCLKIRDKLGSIVQFEPNKHQEGIVKIIQDWKKQYPDEKSRPTLFIMILKCRQVGFSTITEAIFFHEIQFSKNKIAMVISFDDDSVKNISEMASRYYQYLPDSIKPLRRSSLGKGILLENPKFDFNKSVSKTNNPGLQSKFLVDTANNLNAGSSFTINFMHISELPKWHDGNKEKQKQTLTSLLQAVPQVGGIVVFESTAKGLELFHGLWKQAERKELTYKTIFVGWHEHDEYTLLFDNETEKELLGKSLSKKEKKMQETYSLTLEQLNWRRWCISAKCQNDEEQFTQEYPINPNEAFLTSGRPVFDRLSIDTWMRELEKKYKDNPPAHGEIEFIESKKTYEFVPNEYGTTIIYEFPKRGYPYVLSGDIAEGLRNGDWSVSVVIDNTNGNIVAKQRLHIHPDLFALEQIKMARFYNEALIADEVNNHGLTTITSLQKENYWFQYKREIFDRISKTKQQKYGFDTKEISRRRIINRLRQIAREELYKIPDLEILEEMMTFIYNDSDKEIAESDCFDDCVLAVAIGYEAHVSGQQKTLAPRQELDWTGGKDVHWSVKMDAEKNPQMKRYYMKKYGVKSHQIGGTK